MRRRLRIVLCCRDIHTSQMIRWPRRGCQPCMCGAVQGSVWVMVDQLLRVRGLEESQHNTYLGMAIPSRLPIHHGEPTLKLGPAVKSWGCITIGAVATLAPERHIMLKVYRYSEATQSLPITTMIYECGIGYVSRWLQRPLAYA